MIRIGKYEFDGPWKLENVDLLDRACVYAILCKRMDNKYDVIYIGESGQVGTRLSTHHRRNCWENKCQSLLYVATYWTPSDRYSSEDRRRIEGELRDKYDPPCNRQ